MFQIEFEEESQMQFLDEIRTAKKCFRLKSVFILR